MTQTRITDLVLDYSLYPRNEVDAQHVRDLVDALKAGVSLPPIRADRTSKRVTDGFHRVKAHLQHQGDIAFIEVSWRDYASDAAMVRDAIALNASHGRKFSAYDRARCLVLAEQVGITSEELAGILGLTPERLDSLGLRKIAFDPEGKPSPIKETLRHLAQTRIDRQQMQGNKKAGGGRQFFYVNQVINLIEAGIFDDANPRLVKRFRHLISIGSVFLAGLDEGASVPDVPAA